jgi:dTDP-4-amino-4,6-dideoxygalactose transaminase
VLLPAEMASRRSDLIATLRAQGIETTIGTYHMPLTSFFRGRYAYEPGHFPVTDDIASRALTLPLHARLSDENQRRVVTAVTGLL